MIASENLTSGQSDPIEELLWAGMEAICRFAEYQLAHIAGTVRDDLQQYPASGVDEDYPYRNLWDEFCREIAEGPSALESAWEQTVLPHIQHRVSELPHNLAVLLTIACRWDEDNFETQGHETIDEAAVWQSVQRATSQLAADEPGHLWEELGEEGFDDVDTSTAPTTIDELLVGRKFEELSTEEREVYRKLRQASSHRMAQAIVDNLNRNVLERHRKQRLAAKIHQAGTHPSSRVDLELLELGMLAVGYHVEHGTQSFDNVAQRLSDDLELPSAAFADYLPSWYLGVQSARQGAGQDTSNMDIKDAEHAIIAAASLLKQPTL